MAQRKSRIVKLIFWLTLLPIAVVLIAFAIANRAPVSVRFDPLPFAIDLPLYAVALIGIFIGLVSGGIMTWLRGGRWRKLARERQHDKEQLERELAPHRTRTGPAGTTLPASTTSTDITRAA